MTADNVTALDSRRRTPTAAQEAAYVHARFETDNPCPEWCQEPRRHPYRHEPGEPAERALGRQHSASLADLAPWRLGLTVDQPEYAAADGTSPVREVVSVALYATGSIDAEDATSDGLRNLAYRLLAAADRLDTLVIGPRTGPAGLGLIDA
jgi:hypothetical protein